jgi:8-oxo-dGTP pyrophosphatase MutT (NUDIX family)
MAQSRYFVRRASLGLILGLKALTTPVALGAHAIVDDADGRVLLVRHSYRSGWHLPGGGVGAGEPPAIAVIRELKEEIGLVSSAEPQLFGLYTRKIGWASNVIALYRVSGVALAFKPNFEIREILWADPTSPPEGTAAGTRRRLLEFVNGAPPSPYW